MLSLRLEVIHPSLVASLNLFAKEIAAFDSTDLAIAGVYAQHAATALATAREEDGLRAAIQSRQTIGIAQGLLMQRYDLTQDQAFELLRRYSQTSNIKLHTLAERIAQSGSLPPEEEGRPAAGLTEAFGLESAD